MTYALDPMHFDLLSTKLSNKSHQTEELFEGTPCWVWEGARVFQPPPRPKGLGYGRFWYQGKRVYVHRLAFLLYIGDIPPKFEVDHRCRNTLCWNPAHLEAVPGKVNTQRGLHGVLKQACVQGHPYNPENTQFLSNGRRKCRVCARLYAEQNRKNGHRVVSTMKTHCPRGHEYTEENTYLHPVRGDRACRTCKREMAKETYQRRKDGITNGVTRH